MTNRGQIPLLIIALAILLLGYMYFMPLSEKCKLVNMPECEQITGEIYTASPGILEIQEKKVSYGMPSVELFTMGTTETKDLAEMVEVRKGWFTSYSPNLPLDIHEKSKNVQIMVYMVEDKKVKVKINGKTVQTIQGIGKHVIDVSSEKLDQSNTLTVYPTIPFFFWNIKKVIIGKIYYDETYTLTQEKVTNQVDVKEDTRDIAQAMLSFKSDCFYKEYNLSIIINNTEIANKVICNEFEIDVTENIKSSNNFSFFSKGNYFLYKIRLDLSIKHEVWPTYYFNLVEKQKSHSISLDFITTGDKKLTLYVNEKAFAVETDEDTWNQDITQYIKQGQNKLVIIPSETVNIESLKVY